MSNSTRREAERIARSSLPFSAFKNEQEWKDTVAFLVSSIDAALQARDERAAKIAESHSATDCDGPDCGVVIATAIMEDD